MVQKVRQAVILAGGQGTRMRPLTRLTPKPMIEILGKPFLSYIIENLRENGITDIIILVGYLHEKIEKYFGDGRTFGLTIRYSYSDVVADTGTRMRNALPLLRDQVLLLYGDNYWPLRLSILEEYCRQKNARALVTVYRNVDNYTKNNIFVDERGFVTTYDRGRRSHELNGVDIGYFIVTKHDLTKIPKGNVSFEDTVVPALIKKRQLVGYPTYHKYYGLSHPDRLPKIIQYFTPKKICFLDRDGVINKRPPKATYVTKWSEFSFIPGVKDALARLARHGYQLFIITNQSGIARNIMTREDLEDIHKKMEKELGKNGIRIQEIYVCPHGWDEHCFCRKPNPGLLFQAASDYGIDLFKAYMVGDDERDIMAGRAAGCRTVYISDKPYKNGNQPDIIAKSLYKAVERITTENV